MIYKNNGGNMKKITLSIMAFLLTVFGLSGIALLSPVSAANSGLDTGTGYLKETNGGNETDVMSIVKVGINVVLGLIALISVVMIIIGGLNYTTSQGESAKVKKAKDTILYGIIGLVVALLAFALVNFVLVNVFGGSGI